MDANGPMRVSQASGRSGSGGGGGSGARGEPRPSGGGDEAPSHMESIKMQEKRMREQSVSIYQQQMMERDAHISPASNKNKSKLFGPPVKMRPGEGKPDKTADKIKGILGNFENGSNGNYIRVEPISPGKDGPSQPCNTENDLRGTPLPDGHGDGSHSSRRKTGSSLPEHLNTQDTATTPNSKSPCPTIPQIPNSLELPLDPRPTLPFFMSQNQDQSRSRSSSVQRSAATKETTTPSGTKAQGTNNTNGTPNINSKQRYTGEDKAKDKHCTIQGKDLFGAKADKPTSSGGGEVMQGKKKLSPLPLPELHEKQGVKVTAAAQGKKTPEEAEITLEEAMCDEIILPAPLTGISTPRKEDPFSKWKQIGLSDQKAEKASRTTNGQPAEGVIDFSTPLTLNDTSRKEEPFGKLKTALSDQKAVKASRTTNLQHAETPTSLSSIQALHKPKRRALSRHSSESSNGCDSNDGNIGPSIHHNKELAGTNSTPTSGDPIPSNNVRQKTRERIVAPQKPRRMSSATETLRRDLALTDPEDCSSSEEEGEIKDDITATPTLHSVNNYSSSSIASSSLPAPTITAPTKPSNISISNQSKPRKHRRRTSTASESVSAPEPKPERQSGRLSDSSSSDSGDESGEDDSCSSSSSNESECSVPGTVGDVPVALPACALPGADMEDEASEPEETPPVTYNLQLLMQQQSKKQQSTPLLDLSTSSEQKSPAAVTADQPHSVESITKLQIDRTPVCPVGRLSESSGSSSDDESDHEESSSARTSGLMKKSKSLKMKVVPKKTSPAATRPVPSTTAATEPVPSTTGAKKGRKPAAAKSPKVKPPPKPRGRPPKKAVNPMVVATKPASAKAATKPTAATKAKATTKPAPRKASKKKMPISEEFINESSSSSSSAPGSGSSSSGSSSDSSDDEESKAKELLQEKPQEIPPPAVVSPPPPAAAARTKKNKPSLEQFKIDDLLNEVIPPALSPLCSKSTNKVHSSSKATSRAPKSNDSSATLGLPEGVTILNGRPCVPVNFSRILYQSLRGNSQRNNQREKEVGEENSSAECSSIEDHNELTCDNKQHRTEHNRTNKLDSVGKNKLNSESVIEDTQSFNVPSVNNTAGASLSLPPPPSAAAFAKTVKRPESLVEMGILPVTSLPKSLKIGKRPATAAGTPSSIDSPMDEVKRPRYDPSASSSRSGQLNRTPNYHNRTPNHTPSRRTPDRRRATSRGASTTRDSVEREDRWRSHHRDAAAVPSRERHNSNSSSSSRISNDHRSRDKDSSSRDRREYRRGGRDHRDTRDRYERDREHSAARVDWDNPETNQHNSEGSFIPLQASPAPRTSHAAAVGNQWGQMLSNNAPLPEQRSGAHKADPLPWETEEGVVDHEAYEERGRSPPNYRKRRREEEEEQDQRKVPRGGACGSRIYDEEKLRNTRQQRGRGGIIKVPEGKSAETVCLDEARRLKHLADQQTTLMKPLTYVEAVLAFMQSGYAMEQDKTVDPKRIYEMYSQTLKLLRCSDKYICLSHQDNNRMETQELQTKFKKLTIFSWRMQALLNLRLYKLKKNDLLKMRMEINRSSQYKAQGNQPTHNVPSPYQQPLNNTPSSVPACSTATAPANNSTAAETQLSSVTSTSQNLWQQQTSRNSPPISPAGSINSVGSVGSCEQIGGNGPSKTSSSNVGSSTVNVPLGYHSLMQDYVRYIHPLQLCHDLWDSAENMIHEVIPYNNGQPAGINPAPIPTPAVTEWFASLDEDCSPLSMQSSVEDIVCYFHEGISRLKMQRQ